MIRHLSFSDIGSLRALLVREAPAGVYCSNSLYQDPSAEMTKKGWIKANLIFDIDADALKLPCKKDHDVWFCKQCGTKEFGLRPEMCPYCKGTRILEMSWVCPVCLQGTKNETFRLLDFLERDFGIGRSLMHVYFSGSAGFHVELDQSPLDEIDQHGRAEISDYLSARGITDLQFKSDKLSPNDPGWRGRVARYVRDLPPDSPPFKQNEFEKRRHEMMAEMKEEKLNSVLASAVSSNAVRIDSMVTADIHRIFRMPETLNNKTGLVKRECRDLQSFDPASDPIAIPNESESLTVVTDLCPKVRLAGYEYGPYVSGTEIKLPLYVAVYLIAKGAAKVSEKTKDIAATLRS